MPCSHNPPPTSRPPEEIKSFAISNFSYNFSLIFVLSNLQIIYGFLCGLPFDF
jgi:hypothetical protein